MRGSHDVLDQSKVTGAPSNLELSNVFSSQGNGVAETHRVVGVRAQRERLRSSWSSDLSREKVHSRPASHGAWHSTGQNIDETPSLLPPPDSEGRERNLSCSLVNIDLVKIDELRRFI